MIKLLTSLLLFGVFFVSGCSQDPSAAQTTAEATNDSSTKPVLMFFLNPQGGPCLMQAEILKKLPVDVMDRFDLHLVKTTVKDDQEVFYKYGIRGLPSLVLTDQAGKEIKRLPAGVQSEESILMLLSQGGVR